MKMKNLAKALVATAGLSLGSIAFAATGGGATIHNSATLTYGAGLKVSAKVDVQVKTVPAAPTIETLTSLPVSAVPGQVVDIDYRITSASNGFDAYNMQITQNATSATNGSYSIYPSPIVNLNASITSLASTTGAIYIPAGSGKDFAGSSGESFSTSDIIVVNGYYYQITNVTEGTPADTNLGNHTLNAEVPTKIELTPANNFDNSYPVAPVIQPGTIPAGAQVGEVKTITVKFTAGNATTPGTDGEYDITVEGTTGTTDDTTGSPVDFNNGGDTGAITLLSGEAVLVKEARNQTMSGNFAASGVTAKAGDIIEYRLTVTPANTNGVTGAKLADTLPSYVEYKAGSTKLNGQQVSDATSGVAFRLDPSHGGLEVTGSEDDGATQNPTAGEIADGEKAVVTFEVEVK